MVVRNTAQPNIFELSRFITRNRSVGKLSLPVDPSLSLYSRFRHVRGVPSIDRTGGVPLSKLRALDNLIDRLIRLGGKQPIVKNIDNLNEKEIEGLISQYQRGLHQTLNSSRKLAGYVGKSVESALTLNMVA